MSPILLAASRLPKVRRLCLPLALRLEGGPWYSATARSIMALRYGVTIGAYSYGSCFVPGLFPSGVRVGRYVSIAPGVRILRRNHPLDWLSTHPAFFNPLLGVVAEDSIPSRPLTIEHDAWIGENVIIAPGCTRIGIGAVAGAGAVVTRDVDDFAVVGGVPARIIRFRFPEATRQAILNSRWWDLPVSECLPLVASTRESLQGPTGGVPLLTLSGGRACLAPFRPTGR